MPIVTGVGAAIGEAFACGLARRLRSVTYKYQVGSVLCSRPEAMRGVIEKVAIKTVRLISGQRAFGATIPLYVDTYNWFWNEGDLCTQSEAVTLAIAYLQQQQQAIIEELDECDLD